MLGVEFGANGELQFSDLIICHSRKRFGCSF